MTPLAVALLGVQPDGELTLPDDVGGGEWLQAGAICVGSIAVAIAVSRITRGLVARAIGPGFASIITGRVLGYLVFVIGLVYALNKLGIRVGPLLGALGLGGLVIALALQKVVENFVGGLILQARRPFTVGDTVVLDGHTGVVADIDSRTTVLRGLDASMIRIPNGDVLTTPIVNLTRESLRRSELTVGVAYDSNLEQASDLLNAAVGRVRRISSSPPPWVVLRGFGESSIDFSIFYWHPSDVPSELAATHDLVLAVHQALADGGITIPFPQMVVWPGHDAEPPYGAPPEAVFTDRRGAAAPTPRPAAEPSTGHRFSWLPWRS